MGSGISRQGSDLPRRTGNQKQRRGGMKRAISSLFVCGASSSKMEGYPDDLVVNSSEHCQEKLKFNGKFSTFSMGNGASRNSMKTEPAIPSRKSKNTNKNPAAEDDGSDGVPGDNRKYLCEKRESGRSDISVDYSRSNEIASTSYVDQSYPCRLPTAEMSGADAGNGQNCNMLGGYSSQIGEETNNSSIGHSHILGESLFDEVSVENNCSQEIDLVNPDFGSSSVPESPVDLHILRDEIHHEGTPSGLGILVTEREQTRQDGSLTQFDVVGVSTNMSRINSIERSTHDSRRNSRRLFWDAFSRHTSWSRTDSRTFVLSPGDSDHFRSRDRWLLDFGGSFSNEEVGGDLRSSRNPNSNEPLWRSEIWERLRGGLESANHPGVICPRGIHADGSCSCLSRTSNQESTARAGISRIIMLAEALFEVLDQIHHQPMALSLSTVPHPAPSSVVDSFLVKTHRKAERLESVDDISQCYICLAEYEEGDRIRVLPCHHEYHMFCVDKWLKEVHGVCPLCRGDIRVASTGNQT